MDDSILTSIKSNLGIEEECEDFDKDIVMHINTAFSILTQLGVGPDKGYRIKDESNLWSEYLQDELRLELVKDYVYLRVKLIFDPPTSSSVLEAYNKTVSELEWRISVTVDPGTTSEEVG